MHFVFAMKCHARRPNASNIPNAPKTRTQEINGKKIDDAHENSSLNCELDCLK